MIERHWFTPYRLTGAVFLAVFWLGFPAAAQVPQPAPDTLSPDSIHTAVQAGNQPNDSQGDRNGVTVPGPKDDRLFWTLPNLLTVENARLVPPLTPGGKFKLVARDAFDPIQYPFIGFLALVSQAEDSEPAYGQGASGFGKRYAVAFSDATLGSFMTGAILPSLFRQDPRYYQLNRGSFAHRAGYSISRIFVTRTDSGHNQFNISEIAGNAIAAGISNSYHPKQDRSLGNAMSIWWTDIGWDTVANVSKEFWPDIRRMVGRKRAQPAILLDGSTRD